jgi:hypothetical protein
MLPQAVGVDCHTAGKNVCTDTTSLESLRSFRAAMHAAFPLRADALFELSDALLCHGMVGSLPI